MLSNFFMVKTSLYCPCLSGSGDGFNGHREGHGTFVCAGILLGLACHQGKGQFGAAGGIRRGAGGNSEGAARRDQQGCARRYGGVGGQGGAAVDLADHLIACVGRLAQHHAVGEVAHINFRAGGGAIMSAAIADGRAGADGNLRNPATTDSRHKAAGDGDVDGLAKGLTAADAGLILPAGGGEIAGLAGLAVDGQGVAASHVDAFLCGERAAVPGLNGYQITYGASGTWRYSNYGRVE